MPSVIAGYEIESSLGQGAHGVVYRAHAEANPSDVVAVKIVEQTGGLDRLLIEPELLSKFNHPNIVRLRDYVIHAGKLVIVMEFVPGSGLDDYLGRRGRFRAAEVREFLRQMADALSHAHQVGVFHSDVKPSNILVDLTGPSPRYVLVDFGVSRLTHGIQLHKRITGTYSFMAPEQLRGRGGQEADLWAIGAIAYTMLTGVHPFAAPTLDELKRRVLYEIPTFPPAADGDEEDVELRRIIARLLEKNPAERPPSAAALLQELTGSILHKATTADAAKRLPWQERAQREIRRRWKWVVAFVVLAYLPDGIYPALFAAGGAVLVYRGSVQRRAWLTTGGVLLLLLQLFLPTPFGPEAAPVSIVAGFLLVPAAVHVIKIRSLQREVVLVDVLHKTSREELITVLKDYVDANIGDVNAHAQYVETLLAANRPEDAAVEALTLLRVDPYNFDATLLLAHAYLDLGLLDRCEQVCNSYLEIAGHCFEFQDILDRAKLQMRSAA